MSVLLDTAIKETAAMVDVFAKAAARNRPTGKLPDIYGAFESQPASLSYGSTASERYRYFRAWLYIAVNCRASAVARLPWRAAEITNAIENPERRFDSWREKVPLSIVQKAQHGQEMNAIVSHPVLDLLARPNQWQRKSEFIYFSVVNLDLTGECYWILGASDDGKGEQVFSVSSSWMRWDARDKIYKMRISGGAEEVSVPDEFVARSYYANPTDPKGCYSPASACLNAIKTDDYIQQSQQQMFQRGIHPNLMVSIAKDDTGRRQRLTGAQRRQFIRMIREIWSQSVNIGDPVIIDGLIDSVNKLHNTPQEMDWPASGEVVKKRILQTFQINPYIVGEVTGVNRAQAAVAESTFNSFVVNPIASLLSEAMTDLLGPRYESPKRLVLYLEEAKAVDREQRLREWSTLRRSDDVTQDEYREAILGLGPLEKRDDPSSLLQLVGGWTGILQGLQLAGQGLISAEQLINLLVVIGRLPEKDAKTIVGSGYTRMAEQQPALQIEDQREPNDQTEGQSDDEDDDKDALGLLAKAMLADAAAAAAAAKTNGDDKRQDDKRLAIDASRIKQFEDSSNGMQEVLEKYFAESVEQLVDGLSKLDWTPNPDDAESQADNLIGKVFDEDYELQKLRETVAVPMLEAFAAGVVSEREENKQFLQGSRKSRPRFRRKTTAQDAAEKYDLDLPELEEIVEWMRLSLEMPDWMIERAFTALDEAFSQEYWLKVPNTTRDQVATVLRDSIKDGLSTRETANRILEERGPTYTKARAVNTARTEQGNALNAGHSAGIDELSEELGIDVGKVWWSVLGSTTRDSHAALHGTEADEDGMFDLNGVLIPWPSHWKLPASDRCSCQCSLVSNLI